MSTGSLPFVSADRTISRDLTLPDELRAELARPYGTVIEAHLLPGYLRGCRRMLAVGDIVNKSLIEIGIQPDIMIFDCSTQRGPCDESTIKVLQKVEAQNIKVDNPSGSLTANLWNAIVRSLISGKKTKIEVHGEEDLASLACIELAGEGDCVIYGIPDEGISVIRINEGIKTIVRNILIKMAQGRRE
ncbi:MAG: DUF359 domain-containing protein [Thermoplasmata archaeon]|nr:DUF359 domain-containing protein [Thermoplasmata archaeon]